MADYGNPVVPGELGTVSLGQSSITDAPQFPLSTAQGMSLSLARPLSVVIGCAHNSYPSIGEDVGHNTQIRACGAGQTNTQILSLGLRCKAPALGAPSLSPDQYAPHISRCSSPVDTQQRRARGILARYLLRGLSIMPRGGVDRWLPTNAPPRSRQ